MHRPRTCRSRRRSRSERLEAVFADVEGKKFDFLKPTTWPVALEECDQVFLLRPPPIGDMDATLQPFIDMAIRRG